MGSHRGALWAVGIASAILLAEGCHRTSPHAARISINEMMANGAVVIRDSAGNPIVDSAGLPADWVEIHNPLPTPVNLAGYSLTNDPAKPRKFQFPPMLLDPKGFVVVVLDNDPAGGSLHASFKLGAKGRTVYLFGQNGSDLVDQRSYVNMDPDVTAGLYPDGGPSYGIIYVPTPGRPNRRIGVKLPRVEENPSVDSQGDSPMALVTFQVLEDHGIDIKKARLQRGMTDACSGPLPEESILPGSADCTVIGHREFASDDKRRDVQGQDVLAPQDEITYAVLLPKEASGTRIRLKITLENEVGETIRLGCHCFDCVTATVVINEFMPNNASTILFDHRKSDGTEVIGHAPDWIELYNYGDQPVEIKDFALVTGGVHRDINSETPPDFVWRFRDVGIVDPIGPGQFLLILADKDSPYDAGHQPSYKTYFRTDKTNDRPYRSTDFGISKDKDDSFWLLDEKLGDVASAQYDFGDQGPDGIAADLAFGRFPDAGKAKTGLAHNYPSVTDYGEFLNCPTPENHNKEECALDVMPRFQDTVWVEPLPRGDGSRCPGQSGSSTYSSVQVTALLAIDQDTAAADSPPNYSFEAEISYTVEPGGQAVVIDRKGGLTASRIDLTSPGVFAVYKPQGIAGASLYALRGEIPKQPAGSLVTFFLRGRDKVLGGDWVELSEEKAPGVSFRFKAEYAGPIVAINEVFPNSDPGDSTLLHMDYMELFNHTGAPVDLSGMYIDSEKPDALQGPQGHIRGYEIPEGTVLEPHDFLCVYFPRAGEEQTVPAGALSVTAFRPDNCSEILYLLSPDEEGNCIVSQARWDLSTGPPDNPVCPDGPAGAAAVGRLPDGFVDKTLENAEKPGSPPNLNQLDPPTPCGSNCPDRAPLFSKQPFHRILGLPSVALGCVSGEDDTVQIEAAVLINSYAADVLPPPVESQPGGIQKAELLLGPGGERVLSMSRSKLTRPADDRCWEQVKLLAEIRPPHPPVTFYRVRVTDGLGKTAESDQFSFGASGAKPLLSINEVMVRNTKTLTDEHGIYADWIEIHNAGAGPVDAGGMYLTDDLTEPRKWMVPRIPEAVMPSGGFLVLFADGDQVDPDDLHVSFTLKPSGTGDLFLLDKFEDGTCVIDSFRYDFTGLPDDTSIGRRPDGTGDPQALPFPTPRGSNQSSGGIFLRGDINGDGWLNVIDLVWFFEILSEHVQGPSCRKVLDVDDDGQINIADGLYLENFLFRRGPVIKPPFPVAGTDTTDDDLPCP